MPPKEIFTLGPFNGGLNLVDSPTDLAPNELAYCKNYRLGIKGNPYKRPGSDDYGTSPAKVNGDNLVNLNVRYYKADGTKLSILAAGGKLRKGNDVTGAWTDISINGTGASMNTTNLCDNFTYKDRLYITDGTRAIRYNGTDAPYAGHNIPAAPTFTQTTGGSLTTSSIYKYFITSVAGNMGEGPKGAELTVTLTGANNRVDLATILAAPSMYEETTKKIYRTKAGGSLFYFLAEIPTATTTYIDQAADGTLVTEYVPTSRPPDTARFCILGNDDRVYYFGMPGVDASTVKVSDIGFPDRVIDAQGFFTISNNDGDILTGGTKIGSGHIFFKRNSIWLHRGFGYGLIGLKAKDKRGGSIGTLSPFSIVNTPIGLIFLSQRGEIYLYNGADFQEIGRKVAPEFFNMSGSALDRVIACYHDKRYIISYDYQGLKGYNHRTLEYNTETGLWDGPHENGLFYCPSYYAIWDSKLDRGQLTFGEANPTSGSYLYIRNNTSKLDHGGNTFLSQINLPNFSLGRGAEAKVYKVFVIADATTEASLNFRHYNENNQGSFVTLKSSAGAGTVDTFKLGPITSGVIFHLAAPTGQSKLGGRKTQRFEGPFNVAGRGYFNRFELSDSYVLESNIHDIKVLASILPLR